MALRLHNCLNHSHSSTATGMASAQVGQGSHSGSKSMQRQIVEPFAALGQLSYAPATHTTVVTTTTTTTTSFPPMFINAPRNLRDRDPKLYPLASSPAPESIRRFCFDAGGAQACFQESDDVGQSLQEVCLTFSPTCVSSPQSFLAHYAFVPKSRSS